MKKIPNEPQGRRRRGESRNDNVFQQVVASKFRCLSSSFLSPAQCSNVPFIHYMLRGFTATLPSISRTFMTSTPSLQSIPVVHVPERKIFLMKLPSGGSILYCEIVWLCRGSVVGVWDEVWEYLWICPHFHPLELQRSRSCRKSNQGNFLLPLWKLTLCRAALIGQEKIISEWFRRVGTLYLFCPSGPPLLSHLCFELHCHKIFGWIPWVQWHGGGIKSVLSSVRSVLSCIIRTLRDGRERPFLSFHVSSSSVREDEEEMDWCEDSTSRPFTEVLIDEIDTSSENFKRFKWSPRSILLVRSTVRTITGDSSRGLLRCFLLGEGRREYFPPLGGA